MKANSCRFGDFFKKLIRVFFYLEIKATLAISITKENDSNNLFLEPFLFLLLLWK
ncbi:hypothetical protein SAMN05216480_105117 [Pustulibacterium marinum]|uniref:Uncharacterized protein n=1 Tax=Pustulibacterium marinum TaxID=1224947 RepID=A0A1I7GNT2_9FLAO|nr:hypothetical protein SAMN05216480_105117 [Pustulibacterium marinum]